MQNNKKLSHPVLNGARRVLKKAFASVSIIVIPHDHVRTLNLRVPVVVPLLLVIMAGVGTVYVINMAVTGIRYKTQYHVMADRVSYYSDTFNQWNSTMQTLKTAGMEFKHLFSLGSKEDVLAEVNTDFSGSLDLPDLIKEIEKTRLEVDEIKDYLRVQKDIYVATPNGYPINGRITSGYGKRQDPLGEGIRFHSGIDIAINHGTPIKATADGIVSHSGWTNGTGQAVVLEHGLGFSTVYAHNSRNAVKVGQRVRKGDVIAYVGSTGRSTGPHLHYEIWKDGKNVNPRPYLDGSLASADKKSGKAGNKKK